MQNPSSFLEMWILVTCRHNGLSLFTCLHCLNRRDFDRCIVIKGFSLDFIVEPGVWV